jgi:futalosine hydrolase
MMRVLVVAATEFEVGGLMSEVRIKSQEPGIKNQESRVKSQGIEILITGVGMVATAFALGKHLAANRYDLAINLGIAGSFDQSIALGEVVEVIEDSFSELGAEDDEKFLPIEQLGFGESNFKPTARLYDFKIADVRQVSAITVNTVHGNETSIKKLTGQISPQLESMEGASFFYACKQAAVPCLQIRAVSNYVEKRNRDAWQIGLAIKNLNTFAADLLQQIGRR